MTIRPSDGHLASGPDGGVAAQGVGHLPTWSRAVRLPCRHHLKDLRETVREVIAARLASHRLTAWRPSVHA